jgi:hypothetical protein
MYKPRKLQMKIPIRSFSQSACRRRIGEKSKPDDGMDFDLISAFWSAVFGLGLLSQGTWFKSLALGV